MRKVFFALILLCMSILANSQQTVKYSGQIRDTLEQKPLVNAVVILNRSSDSLMISFKRTDTQGKFSFDSIPPGDYDLMVSYPKFADYSEPITLVAGEDITNVSIPMTLLSKVLGEVIVRSAAIRIKGDTTEFNASSFKVREGATVEELLKEMPGFTINGQGEITAQGKKVDKVLVDGEEFFGDDPTVATQNIGAKAVDKVQVYDTKTDQENLTGITNSNAGKTINIKLKEDAKKGAFGKASVGSNFDNLVDAKLMFNQFKGSRKFSVYGTKSNTSTGTLGGGDERRLGIENDMEYDELSDIYYSFGNSDDFSSWRLRGIPDAYAAGALYANKWHGDTNSVNLYYRYNRLGTTNETIRSTQTLLEDTTYYSNQNTKTNGLIQQHSASLKYEWKIDSLATLKFTSTGRINDKQNSEISHSESLDENRAYVNEIDQFTDVKSQKKESQNQLTWRQAFNKKGRLLIGTLRYGIVQDDITTMLEADKRFYEGGFVDSTVATDQLKLSDGQSETFGGKFTFNEPLSSKFNLVMEYAHNRNYSKSYRNTYEKDNNGKYTVLNSIFSNNFNMDAFSNSGSTYLRFIADKIRFSVGSGVSDIQMNLLNVDSNKTSTYNFFNVTPKAQIAYRKKSTIESFAKLRRQYHPAEYQSAPAHP